MEVPRVFHNYLVFQLRGVFLASMSDNGNNTGTFTKWNDIEKLKSTIQTTCGEIDFLELNHKMICRHADKDEILMISTMICIRDNNELLLLMS